MKVGISTASLFLREPTERAAATIKSLGVDETEVFLQTFYEYRPEFSKALAPDICGLNVNSVHVLTNDFEPHLFSPSRRIRGDGFYWLDQVMRSAQLLNCKNYTFHGQCLIKKGCAFSDYDGLAEYICGASEFCARYGVRFCLENVAWSTYNRPGIFKELKSRVPGLYGVFDLKQARRSGYPYQMYINDMCGSISHAHVSDIDSDGKMCLPGRGAYDFETVFKRLKDAGFDGCVLIEAYSHDFGAVEELKQSADYLKELIYKLN